MMMKNILGRRRFRRVLKKTSMGHLAEQAAAVLCPVKLTDLRDNYAEISNELKSQYLLTPTAASVRETVPNIREYFRIRSRSSATASTPGSPSAGK
jgi:hypothetical protein